MAQPFASKTANLLRLVAEEGQRLGHILYGRGLISQEQLEEAVEKTKGKKRLGEVLLDLGYINEDSLKKLIRY